MARSLLHPLNLLRRRRLPLEEGPAELSLAFSGGADGCFQVHARSQEDADGIEGAFQPPARGSEAALLAERPWGSSRHLTSAETDAPGGVPPRDPYEAGRELFDALLSEPEVRRLYKQTRAAAPGGRFRLRLFLDPDRPGMAALHALPWELLFDRAENRLLAVEHGVTVVRTLRVRRTAPPFEPRRPLRVLALLSGARDLDLRRERDELQAVARGVSGFELVVAEATDLAGLEKLLATGCGGRPFQVLHLAGHGGIAAGPEGGVLIWEPPGGGRREVPGRDLATLLGRFEELQLVVLNACATAELPGEGFDPFAGVAAALLQGGVPVVAAVQGEIQDEAAITFSCTFYAGLVAGCAPEEALAAARRELWTRNPRQLEWAKPVLFQGVSPRRLARWVFRAAALLLLVLAILAGIVVLQGHLLGTKHLEHRIAEAQALILDDRPADALQTLEGDLHRSSWPPVPAAVRAAARSTAAVAAEDLGDLRSAVEHAREAAGLEPGRAIHHYNLGALLARSGRPGDAAAPLARALELDPVHADARNELGCVHLDLGDAEKALEVLEPGLDAHSRHPLLAKNAGRALLALGRPSDALPLFERALHLVPLADWPARAEANLWLARAATALGDGTTTCAAVRRLREADPQGVTGHSPAAEELAEAAGCPPRLMSGTDPEGALHAP